jgi:hypothetical protein
VQGPFADRKVVQVALGQNHSMAIDDSGALWTWGNNAQSQLGYALPEPAKKDEDPISTVPRQVFGPLKKETIIGIAASSIHSVAHTGTSLYCWGKNIGQLALMDADSRSLEFQHTPRRVAASLFSSPIVMVTAIDKATTILLQNHTVCVFTAYGYHIVKFPLATLDLGDNIKLSTRYDPARSQIHHITSGGETIAALTKRGDLFTMTLDHKAEATQPATSTTNPSKIKGAVTQPQCIWNARKDGVRSVGVGEHGSVIISTASGAVWRRIKRAKAKDASPWPSESKRKDFKFQRVPYITNAVTVRASAYGAFAAIRKDSDVMKKQLAIAGQSIWEDVAPLNPMRGFQASKPGNQKHETLAFWENNNLGNRLGPVAYEVLKSPDLEEDLLQFFKSWSYRNEPLDAAVCTSSSPDIRIPVHGWLLSARSPVLRGALAQFRKAGSFANHLFEISDADGKAILCFQGLDVVSLLNLVLFAYEDRVIPVWNFTGLVPPLAYRYRQIRLEVMRLATRLDMSNLEAAARLQVEAKKCMDQDFRRAIKDSRFFGDTDVVLELDGADVPVHSAFVCRRCPWFQGLYHGRSGGMWLAGRRAEQGASRGLPDKIKIDMNHMEPEAFKYALQYLYSDSGPEMFDPAVCESLDGFLDLVMEVMSIADYLMLDRLSQICQQVMGRFANIRNIADLLNAISPCAVAEFKKAGLEYICLQLETMLENHLLDELDQALLLELDKVVRANQAAQSPFVRSGRIELLLHENNPELAGEIDEERQIRVKEMAYKAHREEEKKLSSSTRMRYGSLDDASPVTPTPDRTRKASKAEQNELASPCLRPRESHGDLMFHMDEEDISLANSPSLQARKSGRGVSELDHLPPLGSSWKGSGKNMHIGLQSPPQTSSSPSGTLQTAAPTPLRPGKPWGEALTPTSKLDLRDIIQLETSSQSALSAGLAAQKAKETTPKSIQPKMSQKEKKRQQQAAQAAQAALATAKSNPPKNAWERSSSDTPASSPWKPVPAVKSTTSSALLNPGPAKGLLTPDAAASASPSASPAIPVHRRTASPDTRFSGQRTPSGGPSSTPATKPANNSYTGNTSSSRPFALPPAATASAGTSATLIPHSKIYLPPQPKAEVQLGLTMEDIMGQQTRDKQIVKEAVAKRSLQEIQQEQAFQEWWDAESRRMQEEERRREENLRRNQQGSNGNGGAGGGGGRGGGGRGGRRGGQRGGKGGPGARGGSSRGAGKGRSSGEDGNGSGNAAALSGSGSRGGKGKGKEEKAGRGGGGSSVGGGLRREPVNAVVKG